MIEIRNEITGEAKSFADKQAVADFLDVREDRDDWDVGRLGKLPDAKKDENAPVDPKPVKVAVDDGRRADESPSRHLVDPVHSEEASQAGKAKAAEEEKAEKEEAAKVQRQQAQDDEEAQARNRRAYTSSASASKKDAK